MIAAGHIEFGAKCASPMCGSSSTAGSVMELRPQGPLVEADTPRPVWLALGQWKTTNGPQPSVGSSSDRAGR